MTAALMLCSRFASLVTVAFLVVIFNGLEAARLMSHMAAHDAADTRLTMFLAVAQLLVSAAAMIGSTEFVRIHSVADDGMRKGVITMLIAWLMPALVLAIVSADQVTLSGVLLWLLVLTVSTMALEVINRIGDGRLVPSPGHAIARVVMLVCRIHR